MRYFTPDLFLRFNSPDDVVADEADEQWEAAIRGYRDHLDSLDARLPDPVRRLAGLGLHDAELLALEEQGEPLAAPALSPAADQAGLALLSLKQGDEVLALTYFLRDPLRRHPWRGSWPFSPSDVHWLYDEVDVAPDPAGGFVQRILWSDGLVLEVPFVAVLIHRIPLRAEHRHEAMHHSG